MTELVGLLPCQWCQSERIGRDASDIFCMECEAVGPRISFGEPLGAEQRWSARADLKDVEAMRAALERIAGMTDIEADFDGFEAREIAVAALSQDKSNG